MKMSLRFLALPLVAAALTLTPATLSAQDTGPEAALSPDQPGMKYDNLPDLVVTKTTKVPALTQDGKQAGFIEVPKGTKFHPDTVDSTFAYETMMNGQYLRIPLEDTNYVEAKAKLDSATAENPMDQTFTLDEEIVGRVKIAELLPNGFLAYQYETQQGESGAANVYISGVDSSLLAVGNWWTGTVYYIGTWTKPGSSTVYEHFSVNPNADKDVTVPTAGNDKTTGPESAPTLTYDELKAFHDKLALQQTSNNLMRLNVRTAISYGPLFRSADAQLDAKLKSEKVNWLQGQQPMWIEMQKQAEDWLQNYKMQNSFRSWLNLMVSTTNAMGEATIAQYRQGVNKMQRDWTVIQSLYGPAGHPM